MGSNIIFSATPQRHTTSAPVLMLLVVLGFLVASSSAAAVSNWHLDDDVKALELTKTRGDCGDGIQNDPDLKEHNRKCVVAAEKILNDFRENAAKPHAKNVNNAAAEFSNSAESVNTTLSEMHSEEISRESTVKNDLVIEGMIKMADAVRAEMQSTDEFEAAIDALFKPLSKVLSLCNQSEEAVSRVLAVFNDSSFFGNARKYVSGHAVAGTVVGVAATAAAMTPAVGTVVVGSVATGSAAFSTWAAGGYFASVASGVTMVGSVAAPYAIPAVAGVGFLYAAYSEDTHVQSVNRDHDTMKTLDEKKVTPVLNQLKNHQTLVYRNSVESRKRLSAILSHVMAVRKEMTGDVPTWRADDVKQWLKKIISIINDKQDVYRRK